MANEEKSNVEILAEVLGQVIFMFLGFIFLLTIGFMMYKKPDMLQKLMNPNSSSSKPPPVNGMNEEENEHQQGADL